MISVGAGNPYGHPTAATLATLAAHGVPALRTDRDGTVDRSTSAAARSRFDGAAETPPSRHLDSARWPTRCDPLYLIAGTDGAKIDATRARLRARAETRGRAGALEVFEPGEGRGMPDHEALLAAIPAMSLMDSRRYLLADGVERWRDSQLEAVAAAVAELPPDLTLVLIARAKAPAEAGESGESGARARSTSSRRRRRARCRGCWSPRRSGSASGSSPAPPRLLVDRMGAEPGAPAATSSSAWRSGPARGARSPPPTSRR